MPTVLSKDITEKQGQLSRRSFAFAPASLNAEALSVDIIITSTIPVRTYIPAPGATDWACEFIEVNEVLLPDGLDYSRTYMMPLIDGHDTYSGVDKVLGKVENVRQEGDKIVGTAVFRPGKKDIFDDVAAGFLGQVSAGFQVNSYELIPDPEGGIPTANATSWTLLECSLVPIGADPSATVRSSKSIPMPQVSKRAADTQTSITEKKMTLAELIKSILDSIATIPDADATDASDDDKAFAEALQALVAEETGEPTADKTAEATPGTETAEQRALAQVRAIAKARGKDAEAFVSGLIGLRSAKEIKSDLGRFLSERGIAQVSKPTGDISHVIEPEVKRSALASLDASTIFSQRKAVYGAAGRKH